MPMQGNVKFNLKKEDNVPTITKNDFTILSDNVLK